VKDVPHSRVRIVPSCDQKRVGRVGEPDLRRETVETYPPFSLENFLSGSNNGRTG
jgi:hypothetical protein